MISDSEESESLNEFKKEFDLETNYLFRYFQVRDYYVKEIKNDLSYEGSTVIDAPAGANKQTDSRIISQLYQGLQIHKVYTVVLYTST